MSQPWETEFVIHHSQRLLRSFHHYLSRPLLRETAPGFEASVDIRVQAKQLFEAAFIVVSHGTEADPIFNYGNAQALALWEMSWEAFTQLPSRKSALGAERPERAEMLAKAKAQGYFEGYVGDRATSRGKRFRMENGIIWTVVDTTGENPNENHGQAATFSQYHFL